MIWMWCFSFMLLIISRKDISSSKKSFVSVFCHSFHTSSGIRRARRRYAELSGILGDPIIHRANIILGKQRTKMKLSEMPYHIGTLVTAASWPLIGGAMYF